MTSIWQETTENTQSPSLTNDVSTNTVIIGGGLTGTLLSYLLTEEGIENIVLEAKTRGSGKTGNSTAKLTLQHGLTYAKFMRTMGFEKAKLYAEANEKAIPGLRCVFFQLLANLLPRKPKIFFAPYFITP